MRLSQTPPTLLCLVYVFFSHTKSVKALPTRNEILESLGYGYIVERDILCGEQGLYTCTGAQACYTNEAQVAYCSVPGETIETGGSGGYAVYTTTYTETDYLLQTSTWTSSWNAAPTTWLPTATSTWAPAVTAPVICDTSQQETSCGDLCCANWQICAAANSCVANPSSGLTSFAYIASTVATTTSTFSAPLKVTSSTSTTVPFLPAATASGSTFPLISSSTSSHGLSGGAIAGIVIGTIAGVILLLLICFCCIVKAGLDGLLALFGLGSRRNRRSRERVEVIEERYSRHGSGGASRRDAHTGWFGAGGRPATVSESRRKKPSSGLGGFGAVGAGLLGLAVILGLKRRHDEKKVMRERRERSDISSSYYTNSYTGTSESSASSDRSTRDSRHPRR